MNKIRTARLNIPPYYQSPLSIISNGAVAIPSENDGKIVPVLIVDTEHRLDVDDLIKFHQINSLGDAICIWGNRKIPFLKKSLKNVKTVALFIKFTRPSETYIILEFDVIDQAVVVETILSSKLFYLQPGKLGDRLSQTLDNPKILIEVGATGFEKIWKEILHSALLKKFKKSGMSKNEAHKAIKDAEILKRKFTQFRSQ